MKRDLKVVFYGVRGSYPVPGSSTKTVGGNTSCIFIKSGSSNLIFDAGTGIIPLGKKLLGDFYSDPDQDELNIKIFLSHYHHDHIQGLPFFAPFYIPNSNIDFLGPIFLNDNVEKMFNLYHQMNFSPMSIYEYKANCTFHDLLDNDQVNISEMNEIVILENTNKSDNNSIVIKTLKSYAHPRNGSLIYWIEINGKSIVYATDTEGYVGGDQRLINFSKNADLLIHDSQYTNDKYLNNIIPTQGFGHSTSQMAIEVAKAANVKSLVLFHHDPSYNDDILLEQEKVLSKEHEFVTLAKEGLEINF